MRPSTDCPAQPCYAGFFVRLAAFLLDSMVVGLLSMALFLPKLVLIGLDAGAFLDAPILFHYTLWNILTYLLGTGYFVLCTAFCGRTLGKYLLRLRVVRLDGKKSGFLRILYRETIGRYLSAIILGIGYILIGVDHEKRALHDLLADTRVVYTLPVPAAQNAPAFTPGAASTAGPTEEIGPENALPEAVPPETGPLAPDAPGAPTEGDESASAEAREASRAPDPAAPEPAPPETAIPAEPRYAMAEPGPEPVPDEAEAAGVQLTAPLVGETPGLPDAPALGEPPKLPPAPPPTKSIWGGWND